MNKHDGAHPGFATNKFRAEELIHPGQHCFVVGLADVAISGKSENGKQYCICNCNGKYHRKYRSAEYGLLVMEHCCNIG